MPCKMPKLIPALSDGQASRFTDENTDIAVKREGDRYVIYDYESGQMSKNLSREEVIGLVRDHINNAESITAFAKQKEELRIKRETEAKRLQAEDAEIDSYARENIGDYTKLNDPNRGMIRKVIREGRAKGIESDTLLTAARVSARSGMDIVFDSELSGAGDAKISGNTIYVDPNASKERMRTKLLLHEAGHEIFKGKKWSKFLGKLIQKVNPKRYAEIAQRYSKYYKSKKIPASQYIETVQEEIAMHHIEDVLGNINAWDAILAEEPSAKDKFLSFLKRSVNDYSGDEKLSRSAKKLLNIYKKLFTDLSERNYQNNASENSNYHSRFLNNENRSFNSDNRQKTANLGVNTEKYALKTYSEKQKDNWKNSKNIIVYESQEQFKTFIDTSIFDRQYNKKIYLGSIGKELAERIYNSTGLNLENYNATLRSDEVRKILKDHGNEAKERLQGQRAVIKSDFLSIPDVIQNATDIKRSKTDYEGKPAIEFVLEESNSWTTIIAVVSDKHLDLRVQTEYIHPQSKKGILATPLGEQAPNNTPEAGRGTDSTVSISQKSEKSNSSGKNILEERNALPESGESQTFENVDSENVLGKDLMDRDFPGWRDRVDAGKNTFNTEKILERGAPVKSSADGMSVGQLMYFYNY